MTVGVAHVCRRICRFLVLSGSGGHRDLHSFPTRRSSDLTAVFAAAWFSLKEVGRRLVNDDSAWAGLKALVAAPARAEELAAYRDFLASARRTYAAKPKLAQEAGLTAEQAAWWQVAAVMLNSDRALNKE